MLHHTSKISSQVLGDSCLLTKIAFLLNCYCFGSRRKCSSDVSKTLFSAKSSEVLLNIKKLDKRNLIGLHGQVDERLEQTESQRSSTVALSYFLRVNRSFRPSCELKGFSRWENYRKGAQNKVAGITR